jgi:uncharacterized protein YbjT (DUF2867 family)
MKKWNVLMAGGSGLVGSAATQLLLADPRCSELYSVLRKAAPSGVQRIALDSFEQTTLPNIDVVCIALGTTIKKAGSQQAFRQVDYDLVLTVAQKARQSGARRCVVITALGSDAKSSIFYNRVKGEVEQGLQAKGFEQLVILRPSLLLGDRQESRPGESLGQLVAPLLSPFLIGGLRRYRPIQSDVVARCMVESALDSEFSPSVKILESDEIAVGW